jgi:hypothetical protein
MATTGHSKPSRAINKNTFHTRRASEPVKNAHSAVMSRVARLPDNKSRNSRIDPAGTRKGRLPQLGRARCAQDEHSRFLPARLSGQSQRRLFRGRTRATAVGARAQSVLMSVSRTCWQQQRSALDFLSQLLRGVPVALALSP